MERHEPLFTVCGMDCAPFRLSGADCERVFFMFFLSGRVSIAI